MNDDEEKNIDFLGKGWAFPINFNNISKSISMSTGDDDIKQSLNIILSTIPGERGFHPDFGCDLSDLTFENFSATVQTKIKEQIKNVVLLYEPRIIISDIKFEDNTIDGIIYIHIFYQIKSTNSRTNIVYPYYILEATDL